tara:strand:- start:185 stop:736 length:552 start_codon:yes stop_codon:yes gene_type:complete
MSDFPFSIPTTQPTSQPSFNHIQTSVNGGVYIYSVPGYNGSNEVKLTPLSGLTITPNSSSQNVVIHMSVYGEWQTNPHAAAISLKRVVGGVETWLDGRPSSSDGFFHVNAQFSITHLSSSSPAPETLSYTFVDTPNTNSEITYDVYLKNSSSSQTFSLNRTTSTGSGFNYERGISTFTAECKG